MAKTGELQPNWWHVDANGKVVGRLASDIAMILMGKHRPTYTPHVDTGDFVVVTNVEKVVFSGKKWNLKTYSWYTGYTGQRIETAGKRLERKPEEILREAVRRMLPKNRLGRKMLQKLKLFVGPEHPHQAQQPQALELGTGRTVWTTQVIGKQPAKTPPAEAPAAESTSPEVPSPEPPAAEPHASEAGGEGE
jgi:large subunit ribosomal protein L13